jgi:hypothetical protein
VRPRRHRAHLRGPSTSPLAGMGSEIAIPIFGPLIIIGVAALLYLALAGRSFVRTESALLGLGRRRLAMGYLGALMVLAVYNYIDTVDLSRARVTRGDVTAAEAARYFWGWYIYGLCLITPFVIFFITVLGLPLLALLRRLEFASVLGGVAMSQLVALCFSLCVVLFLDNQWCDSHTWKCFYSDFMPTAVLAGALTFGFVVAARLPWWRSPPMPADNRWRGP